METNPNRQRAIENYIKAYNKFDVEGMLADLHEDIRFENISNGETNLSIQGIEDFKKQAVQAAALFNQREQRIQHIRFKEDLVEVDIAYTATLAADLPNGLKAGDKLELTGKSVFRFQGDKIIEIRDIS